MSLLINFFTFNMGGTHDYDWKIDEIKSIFTIDDTHIWAVCTQEDQNKSKFMAAVTTYFGTTKQTYVCIKQTKPFDLVKPFAIHLNIYIPTSVLNLIKSTYSSIFIFNKPLIQVFYPKGASVIV